MTTEYIYAYTEEDIKSVAEALRTKIDYSKKLIFPDEFIDKIKNSAEVTVDQKRVTKELLEGTITSVSNDDVVEVGYKTFYNCTLLTTVTLPNCAYIDSYAFQGCTTLTTVSLPTVEIIKDNAFKDCAALSTLTLPCAAELYDSAFINCYSLQDLILSNPTRICYLESANVFTNCYHITGEINATYNSTGAKDGYIYVPNDLVDSYKAATNWSKFASQIKPLSEYS